MEKYASRHQINFDESRSFIIHLLESDLAIQLRTAQNTVICREGEELVMEFKLPFIFTLPDEGADLDDLMQLVQGFEETPNYLIILMEAGQAALGNFEEGQIDSHKVIRKYMVRAKQGKVQLSHLKTKGKSKLGSRIRLAQSKEFFEDINEKLKEWEVEDVDLIFYKSSIQLWNGLFEAANEPPFEKRDERLRKIPKDLPTPTYELLLEMNKFILEGELKIFKEEYEDILDELEG